MRIGSESTCITPVQPVELAGYGYFLHRFATGVESHLQAHALTFEDDTQRAALCSADLLSLDTETVEKIADHVSGQLPEGPRPTLLVNASHTHSGVTAARRLLGVGRYNSDYVDETLVPHMAGIIVNAFNNAEEGTIGLGRKDIEGLSYNRTGSEQIDNRLTVVRIDTEQRSTAGAHFSCHPVIYGKNSTVISSEYPGVARNTLHRRADTDTAFWLTGCAGDIDPAINRYKKGHTSRQDIGEMGRAVGVPAAELYAAGISHTAQPILRAGQAVIELPLNTDFELNPSTEVEIYRESRHLPRSQNLGPLEHWLKIAAPIVNGNEATNLEVPVTVIAIGKLVFAGFGAEIYSETGLAIEANHSDLEIVAMMNANDHAGYIPPAHEYDANTYASRSSAFIFEHKPLTPESEQLFGAAASKAIANIMAS